LKETKMLNELRLSLRPALVLLSGFTVLLGLAFPLAVTGIAQLALPNQANGSLVRDGDTVVGSALIGQDFATSIYFHPRLSAAGKGYDASASSGSNLAPGSADLDKRIADSVAALRTDGVTGPVPVDLVTTSGSGLDPDISPAAARIQIARVAKARGVAETEIAALVDANTTAPVAGLFGEPRVNVLALNRQLDARHPLAPSAIPVR
jgi:K+-transporting ATPase ATPase C chain